MATLGGKPNPSIYPGFERQEGFWSPGAAQNAGFPIPSFADHNPQFGFAATVKASGSSHGLSDAPTTEVYVASYGSMLDNLGPAPSVLGGIGFDWFEKIHIFPQRLDLGNVISDIVTLLEIYSAYRRDDRVLTAFTNNAGAGITTDLPTPPLTMAPQTSLLVNVTVSTNGPPVINGTLDFTFDIRLASVPITGTRITLFEFVPQGGVTEKLEFLTNIMKARDGTEQRVALRRFPRHRIKYKVLTVSDRDRNRLNSFMVDWSSRLFAVPIWWEARRITTDTAVSATTIDVVSTDYARFVVGGLALIMQVDVDGTRTVDTLEIASLTANSITLTSGVQNVYQKNVSFVVPAIPGVLNSTVPKSRRRSTLQELTADFLLIENEQDLSDTTAFTSFNGRVTIEDANFIDGQIQEEFSRKVIRLDENTGELIQTSGEDRAVIASNMRWEVESAQRLWEIRQLLHALKGRQVSFYQPTFNHDFTLAAAASSGSTAIDVVNVGYTTYVKSREPYNAIRIVLVEGTLHSSPLEADDLRYIITGSSEVTADVERLTIAGNLPLDIDSTNVERIEFIMLNRMDNDTVEIFHRWNDMEGQVLDAMVNMPVRGVYDG